MSASRVLLWALIALLLWLVVYPNAFDTHGVWAVAALFLMKYGAGSVSLDNLFAYLGGDTARYPTK